MTETRDELAAMLDTCLQNLYEGRWTVEECLNRYPDHRGELEPLLRAAASLRSARALRASPAFRSNAQARLAQRLQPRDSKPIPRRAGTSHGAFPRRLVSYGMALLAVLILAAGSAGTIYAAEDSAPGETLYGVKLTVEQAQLDFTPPEQAIGLKLKFAEKRLKEAEKLAARGDTADLQVALDGYDQLISQIAQSVGEGSDDQTLASIDTALSAHQARLQALLATVPEPAKKGISRAIEASQHGQEQAAQARSKHDGKPDKPGKPNKPSSFDLTPTPTGGPEAQPHGKPTDKPGSSKPGGGQGKPADTPGNGPPLGTPGANGNGGMGGNPH